MLIPPATAPMPLEPHGAAHGYAAPGVPEGADSAIAGSPAHERFEVQCELLRMSTRPLGPMLALQFLLNIGVAALFGWLYSVPMALTWIAMIAAVTAMRGFWPQRLAEPLDAGGLRAGQRLHLTRTAIWECAHGSAGVLLFDPAHAEHQLLLGVIMLGMTLSSAFSVSCYRPALQMAVLLLLGPLVAMGLLNGVPMMQAAALLGVGLLALMGKLVADHVRRLAENIALRLSEHTLREQATEALARVEQAQRQRLRFFSAANHDLRQPVMAIGLQCEVLRAQLGQGPDASPDLSGARRTVQALSGAQSALEGLTHQLLEIGRLEAGADALEMAPIALAPLLRDVARQVAGSSANAGEARVHVRCPEHAMGISDPTSLRRMLTNLADNAVKFSADGRVLLACRRRGRLWRLEVRDSGPGIAPDSQLRVFDDFEQVGNQERNLQRGHGLGLAIVRRLAQRLQTGIDLRSAPGAGSVFAFDIVAAPDAAVARSAVPAPAPAPAPDRSAGRTHAGAARTVAHPALPHDAGAAALQGSAAIPAASTCDALAGQLDLSAAAPGPAPSPLPAGLAVLVVEDNTVVAESLAALLGLWGVRTRQCISADDALALDDLPAFDVALCDIRLPGSMDGVALATCLTAVHPRLRIVLVSADVDEATIAMAHGRGWAALRKPIVASVLRGLLAQPGG